MEDGSKLEMKKRLLLDHLVKNGYLKDKRLFKAFLDVPLEDFIPNEFKNYLKIYEDMPNLFYYQNDNNYRTISAPHMISIMLQGLSLKENDDLLILGAKSGYIAALAHELAPKGRILILEANAEITRITTENIKKFNLADNIEVIVKNPLEGMPEKRPWQKILVTGAITQNRIHPLLRQLDPNKGVLYAPIGEDFIQIYTQILRMNEEFFGKRQLQVRFSPLMTQIELDELELITDLDEIEIIHDPEKVDENIGEVKDKINVKYASSLLEDLEFKFRPRFQSRQRDEIGSLLSNLEDILRIIKILKKEDDIGQCFECIENIEFQIENLNRSKGIEGLDVKKIQNFINQIRTYNIIRKDLSKSKPYDSDAIDKKIEIINKQMEKINNLQDYLKAQIRRLKNL